MSIGERLKSIRESRNMTQEQVAKAAGITKQMVCAVEKGYKAMSLPVAVAVADVLSCTVSDFLTDTPNII